MDNKNENFRLLNITTSYPPTPNSGSMENGVNTKKRPRKEKKMFLLLKISKFIIFIRALYGKTRSRKSWQTARSFLKMKTQQCLL
ncbi:hypothetical protein Pint_33436 [Pistacia integerrima]|uniref:Uncharacterized protein n=1 Tax=Pistacia integerrima TaxID=434235 RepID=A0ACC0X7B1_9ROSI|nr:hypothetical protein Pint_33436 [Pistacia integerrima]